MSDQLTSLEHRIDDLIRMCKQLRHENESLRADNQTRLQERTQLVEKNRLARDRLERIVGRLRDLENLANE